MRIITGSARGTRLETREGEDTRPTAERVKEALFSMIQFEIEGREVLDLFAGSGQLALEALSRGAAKATLVDIEQEAVKIIKSNAQRTKLFDRCVVLGSDWKTFVRNSAHKKQFDIVFLDPPYALGIIPEVLRKLTEADMLRENALVICESDTKEPFCAEGMRVRRHSRYGRVYITLLEKCAEDEETACEDADNE